MPGTATSPCWVQGAGAATRLGQSRGLPVPLESPHSSCKGSPCPESELLHSLHRLVIEAG